MIDGPRPVLNCVRDTSCIKRSEELYTLVLFCMVDPAICFSRTGQLSIASRRYINVCIIIVIMIIIIIYSLQYYETFSWLKLPAILHNFNCLFY